MKVLVISHNVFCKTTNMGKTLMAYFNGWDAADIAQLYIHSEIPTETVCKNYYRMTDKDIIKSVFTRKSGTVFGEADIRVEEINSRTDTGATARLYQKARSRTPLIYFMRNLWWSLGAWKTKKLLRWVDEFSPDIIFFASGDYAFMYKIALKLAKMRGIPLAVSCMDDYYFDNRNEKKFGGKFLHRRYMKQVKKTMEYSSCIFAICEKMSKDYAALFGKPCHTLGTPASINEPLTRAKTGAISYMGNLGYNRNLQLIAMGRALKSLDLPGKPDFIDVYSAESRRDILEGMSEENGIKFHGKVSGERVLEIMGESLAVIHTESFDAGTRKSVAYSVSTKIADSLAGGTCILAYGPPEIASVEYLKTNRAAYCITAPENLESGLKELLRNGALRAELESNAMALAAKNHSSAKNCKMIRTVLCEAAKK